MGTGERTAADSCPRQGPHEGANGDPTLILGGHNGGSEDVYITATCESVSTHCYIFVDNSASRTILTEAFIAGMAGYFDSTAYPTDTSVFGGSTDTDGDAKIYILFSQLEAGLDYRVLGYFHPRDKYPTSYYPHSNQHDMFYLTIPREALDLDLFQGVLAHEFQHMINFDHHRANGVDSERVWLNEALSELASFICTQDSSSRLETTLDYLNLPCSLTIWDYNTSAITLKNYAGSRLFGLYLYDRFCLSEGRWNLLREMVDGTSRGIRNVADQTGVSFNNLFRDWVAALYLSDTGLTADPRYQYRSLNLHANGLDGLQSTQTWIVGNSYSAEKYPYTPLLRSISGILSTTTITLTGTGANVGGVVIAHP